MENIRIYNLYPKLVGTIDKWIKELPRIKKMNFDYVYVNPFHLTGESNSDYSVKDYYSFNPMYLEEGQNGDEMIKKFCSEAKKKKMKVMMDLVINHTATDSPLINLHPEWYLYENGKIVNPFCMDGDTKVVWEDLAEIDNLHSSKRDELWKYWLDMILHFCSLGITGFRCDAVFMIPTDLWKYLIYNVKKEYSDAFFLGETLGCSPDDTVNTLHAGFDMVMTAYKWWDFKAPWFCEQYNEMIKYGKTLSFPENHDTTRCSSDYNGNGNFAMMKFTIASYLSKANAITTGFEYGYRRKIDVTATDPSWNEEPYYDLSLPIAAVNKNKSLFKVLNNDGSIYSFEMNQAVMIVKYYDDEALLMAINDTLENIELEFNPYDILHKGKLVDVSPSGNKVELSYNTKITLYPGDVLSIVGK